MTIIAILDTSPIPPGTTSDYNTLLTMIGDHPELRTRFGDVPILPFVGIVHILQLLTTILDEELSAPDTIAPDGTIITPAPVPDPE